MSPSIAALEIITTVAGTPSQIPRGPVMAAVLAGLVLYAAAVSFWPTPHTDAAQAPASCAPPPAVTGGSAPAAGAAAARSESADESGLHSERTETTDETG